MNPLFDDVADFMEDIYQSIDMDDDIILNHMNYCECYEMYATCYDIITNFNE